MKRGGWPLAVCLLLLAGLALRADGLDWSLPYQLDPDEPALFLSAAELRTTGARTLKPNYPPLRVLELAAEQASLPALSGGEARQDQLFFFGRVASALFWALLMGAAYQAGRRLAGPATGGLAALFLAFEPASAELGRLIRADTLAWLCAMGSLAFTFLVAGPGASHSRRQNLRLAVAFGLGLAAFLAKYNLLPVLAAPAMVLLYRVVPAARLRAWLLLGGAGLLVVGLVLVRTSEPVRAFLLEGFGLHRLLRPNYNFAAQVQANSRLLLENLGALTFLLALAGLAFVYLLSRRSPAGRARLAALLASALVGIAIYTQADARFKDMYALVLCLALLWATGVAGIVSAATRQVGQNRLSGVLSLAAGVLLAAPWIAADARALGELRTPDTRILTAEWLRQNVPQGARVACEYDCVELQAAYGGFPGPQPFHTEIVRSLFERTPEEYRRSGIEYLIADGRVGGYLGEAAGAGWNTGVREVARYEGAGYAGPARAILQVPPLQGQALYRWLGEAISFRGYDLPQTTVAPGGELPLTLYWMSARTTPANLIVFVHLVADPASPPVAGHDGPPLNGAQPTWGWAGDMQFWVDARAVPIPAGTPLGDYLLQVGMYDADTGERLPVRSPAGEQLGTEIALEVIEVR